MLKKPLEIECLWHTDETKPLAESGVEFNVDDLDYKTMTFYSIAGISPYDWDKDHHFCKIHANDDYWIVPFTYEEVKKMIENED